MQGMHSKSTNATGKSVCAVANVDDDGCGCLAEGDSLLPSEWLFLPLVLDTRPSSQRIVAMGTLDPERSALTRGTISGYVSIPTAATHATARSLDPFAVVLVEGISDQIALETLAERRGRDLEAERVVILPIGGAQAIGRHLSELASKGVK